MGNAEKAAFLGIPHGTAANRLRKQLLFKYIKQAGDHICFKCGREIESVADLSIEHKEPWEGRSVDAFWDLDNISFSHLRCNKQHIARNGSHLRRKIGPEGTSWCCKCLQYLPISQFGSRKNRWNGVHPACRECRQSENWDH